jgi:hypothetical protein
MRIYVEPAVDESHSSFSTRALFGVLGQHFSVLRLRTPKEAENDLFCFFFFSASSFTGREETDEHKCNVLV